MKKWYKKSWSQEGEDILLERFFGSKKNGKYIDIGAFHPYRFSNSYWAYRKGWSGVCIDARPDFEKFFKSKRPRDIVLQSAIGKSGGYKTYFEFDEPALNTFLEEKAMQLLRETNYRLTRKSQVQCKSLEQILDSHLAKSVADLDFMSIDIEGMEYEALISNNFKKYRPKIILAEIHNSTIENIERNPLSEFVKSWNYKPVSLLYHSVFYVLQE